MNQNSKIIKQLPDLSQEELVQLHTLIYHDSFKISIGDGIFPVGVFPELLQYKTIRCESNDPNAEYKIVSLETEQWSIPISIFLLTRKWEFQSMFLLGANVQNLFQISREVFCAKVGDTFCDQSDELYEHFLSLRTVLIKKIFEAYYTYDSNFEAFMFWDVRGKKSITRTVAEKVGFNRIELDKIEFYFKNTSSFDKYDFKEIIKQMGICRTSARKRYHFRHILNSVFKRSQIKNQERKMELLIDNYCYSFAEARKLAKVHNEHKVQIVEIDI